MHSLSHFAVTLAVAVSIGAVGCSAQQPLVVRDDATITTDVRARMAADTQLNRSGITVDTKAGVVSLVGSVQTDEVRNAAERVARETPGVRSVDNDVTFGLAEVPPTTITR